jgi:hypothetical protein
MQGGIARASPAGMPAHAHAQRGPSPELFPPPLVMKTGGIGLAPPRGGVKKCDDPDAVQGDPQELVDALGHWAEDDTTTAPVGSPAEDDFAAKLARDHPELGDEERAKALAAFRIKQGYVRSRDAQGNVIEGTLEDELLPLDLESPEGRVASMDLLTQNDPSTARGEDTCAASSLVAAVILAEGTDGVLQLMDAMERDPNPNMQAQYGERLKELRARIMKGEPLTVGDVHDLQQDVYTQIKSHELQKPGQQGMGDATFGSSMRDYLAAAPELGEMMARNHMEISYIDNQGDGRSHHAVLSIGALGEEGKAGVYDPYLRREGQMITDPDELERYRKAQVGAVS